MRVQVKIKDDKNGSGSIEYKLFSFTDGGTNVNVAIPASGEVSDLELISVAKAIVDGLGTMYSRKLLDYMDGRKSYDNLVKEL